VWTLEEIVGMNFSEALNALRAGSKVSRGVWKGGVYSWHMEADTDSEPKIFATYPSGQVEQIYSMMIEDILADDWWVVT
jgi:hypothetical protein